MRVVGLHPDVVVATSAAWQTTCTLVRSADEAFCVDSPVLPQELETLPMVAGQAQFNVVGLIATHADWDHVLGRYAFPEAPLAVGEASMPRLRSADAQRALRDFDGEWYVEGRGPLTLGEVQPLPVPGHVGLGATELELHPAPGHTEDGMAILVPHANVLIAGDYLSPVEIPMVTDRTAYLATLDALEALVERAAWVIPGHGAPLEAERALAILREDRAYVSGLPGAALPLARRSRQQREIHERNVQSIGR